MLRTGKAGSDGTDTATAVTVDVMCAPGTFLYDPAGVAMTTTLLTAASVFGVACLGAFVFLYAAPRPDVIMKAQPSVTVIIGVGLLLTLACVGISLVATSVEEPAQYAAAVFVAQTFLQSTAFALVVGGLFSKSYRVFRLVIEIGAAGERGGRVLQDDVWGRRPHAFMRGFACCPRYSPRPPCNHAVINPRLRKMSMHSSHLHVIIFAGLAIDLVFDGEATRGIGDARGDSVGGRARSDSHAHAPLNPTAPHPRLQPSGPGSTHRDCCTSSNRRTRP